MSNTLDIQKLNTDLQYQTPTDIIKWAVENSSNPIITTNFRPHTAAILHLVTQVKPDIPVLWVDTGYNTEPTLEFADKLTKLLDLNLTIKYPEASDRLNHFKNNGIPLPNHETYQEFTDIVKLQPFQKAMDEISPDAWITGIRNDQTDFRKSLDILSTSKTGILKVAPIYYWSKQQQLDYIAKHNLPDEHRYFDPTKAEDHKECGIQLL